MLHAIVKWGNVFSKRNGRWHSNNDFRPLRKIMGEPWRTLLQSDVHAGAAIIEVFAIPPLIWVCGLVLLFKHYDGAIYRLNFGFGRLDIVLRLLLVERSDRVHVLLLLFFIGPLSFLFWLSLDHVGELRIEGAETLLVRLRDVVDLGVFVSCQPFLESWWRFVAGHQVRHVWNLRSSVWSNYVLRTTQNVVWQLCYFFFGTFLWPICYGSMVWKSSAHLLFSELFKNTLVVFVYFKYRFVNIVNHLVNLQL